MGNKKSTPYLSRPHGDVVSNPLSDTPDRSAESQPSARTGSFADTRGAKNSETLLALTKQPEIASLSSSIGLAGILPGVRRVYIQKDDNGFGFMFSTNIKMYSRGINHFVSAVDENGPAELSGLRPGDRLLQVNSISLLNLSHGQVVSVLQAAGKQRFPLRLLVCESNALINASLSASRAQSPANLLARQHSVLSAGSRAQLPLAAPQPRAPVKPSWRVSLVVVRRASDHYLLSINSTRKRGWWLPAGEAASGESFEEAAHRQVFATTNLRIRLVGVLRVEHDVDGTRVVFLASPIDDGAELKKWSDKYSAEAKWMSVDELRELQNIGRPPWKDDRIGLRGTELLDWGQYLDSGGVVAPLHFLSAKQEPVSPDRQQTRHVTSEGISMIPCSIESCTCPALVNTLNSGTCSRCRHPTTRHTAPPSPNTALSTITAFTRSIPQQRLDFSEADEDAAAASAAATAAATAPSAASPERQVSAETDVSPATPAVTSQLVSAAAGASPEARRTATQEQIDEIEASVSDVQLQGLWIPLRDKRSFGIHVKELEFPELEHGCAVVVDSLVEGGAAHSDGRLFAGDRILKINDEYILDAAHARAFLRERVEGTPAVDLTITRNEPLPEMPNFEAKDDRELESAVFEHLGMRILVNQDQGWSRKEAINVLMPRFSRTDLLTSSAPQANAGINLEDMDETEASTDDARLAALMFAGDTPGSSDVDERTLLKQVANSPSLTLVQQSGQTAPEAGDAETDADGADDDGEAGDVVEALRPLPHLTRKAVSLRSSIRKSETADGDNRPALARRVSFREDNDIREEYETWAKEEYPRPLDPGEGVKHLRELFYRNNFAMENEQEEEVKRSVDLIRLHGLWIPKNDAETYGLTLEAIPRLTPKSPDFLFSEAVVIKELDPEGAAAKAGSLRVGDRIVKINNDWITCMQQAAFFMEMMVEDSPATDFTITRNEPLPDMPDFTQRTDKQVEGLVFEHLGMRLTIDPDNGGWSRDQALGVLKPRFFDKSAPPPLLGVDDDDDSRATIGSSAAAATLSSSSSSVAASGGKRGVHWDATNDLVTEYETWAKEEYDRVLDVGEHENLAALFHANNDAMEQEQEQEVRDLVAESRIWGFWLSKGDEPRFGMELEAIPRSDRSLPLVFCEGVVISKLEPDSPAARDGRFRVGDRIVKINNDWITCLSQANFLLHDIAEQGPAVDLAITRNEELPPAPDFDEMTDTQIEGLAFEHLGMRIHIDPDNGGWSRKQAMTLILPRFAESEL
eukprot:m.152673 g.152673  ORF g.152673 m.152673 type:complete len:1261 (-) comp10168_c1_seq3:296-4078(-)